jgi:hypothetical protein
LTKNKTTSLIIKIIKIYCISSNILQKLNEFKFSPYKYAKKELILEDYVVRIPKKPEKNY